MEYDTQEATALLAISPKTLRDWSEHFASLLSDTAQLRQVGDENAAPQRYTENDLGLLRQIKALLNAGHNYEQAQAVLVGAQANGKPKRSARRPARQKGETQTLTPSESMNSELVALRASSEQVIAAKDQQIAELEQMLQVALRTTNERVVAAKEQQTTELEHMLEAEQRRIEHLSRQVGQLQAENQALRERFDQAEKGYAPSFSFQLRVLLVMIVVAALITIFIELAFNPNF